MEIRIPVAALPIDGRHRRAFSQMQFVRRLSDSLRVQLNRDVVVQPSAGDQFAIDHQEKAGLPFGDLDAIDLAVTTTIMQLEQWRADAEWAVSWDAVDQPDGTRRGIAVWDSETHEFTLRVAVEGATVFVGLRHGTEPAKWYRCVTPFARPNEYAIDQAIERACQRWLPACGPDR